MGMLPYTFIFSVNVIMEIQCDKYDVPAAQREPQEGLVHFEKAGKKICSFSFLFDITLFFIRQSLPLSLLSFHRSIFNSFIQPYFCSLLPVVAASILPSLLEPDTDSQPSTPLSRTPGILLPQSSITRPCSPPPSVQSQHSSHFHPPTYPLLLAD